jgi:glycosyltransferase involved in cell wall biosynthesis
MRVAVVSHDVFWPLRGGGGVRVFWVVKALAGLGHDVCVVAPVLDKRGLKSVFPGVHVDGIGKMTRFVRAKEAVYAWMMFRIFLKLCVMRPDLVYAHNVVAALPAVIACKWRRIPVVFDMDDLLTGYSKQPLVYRLGPFLEKWTAKRADRVIVPSRLGQAWCSEWGVRRTAVVRHGVDLERFVPAAGRKKTFISFTGGVEINDGVLLVPDAAKRVLERHPQAVFLFAGEGKALPALIRRVRQLNLERAFEFRGWVDQSEVAAILGLSSVGLITSLKVSATVFSSPLRSYEYMASGLPFVAPDLDGIREQVEDSRAGTLFKSGDADDLAGAILKLLDDKAMRLRLGRNGRAYAEKQCDWKINSAAVERICEEAVQ